MKLVKLLLVLLITTSWWASSAQNWIGLDTIFSTRDNPKFMYVDTAQDRLYLGGEFINAAGRAKSLLYYYDGHQIHNIDTLKPIPSGMTQSMARYQGELYVGGHFSRLGKNNVVSYSIAKMQNDTFVSVNTFPAYTISDVYDMVEYKGKLILGFNGDSLGGLESRGIVQFDGTSFSPMGGGVLSYNKRTNVYTLHVFKGKLYAGGNFTELKNTGKADYRTTNFQVWNDDTQVWEIVNGWKGGHVSSVNELLELKGDLYLIGGWKDNDSAIGNDVVRFDGQFFYSIGKGTKRFGITKARIHNNEIYVCGGFEEIDGIKAYGIAKWNGKRWCNISNDVFTRFGQIHGMDDVAFYHDSLFVLGTFDGISGKPIKTIAKWIADSSMTGTCAPPVKQDTVNYNLSVIDQENSVLQWKVYPNPSNGQITIEYKNLNTPAALKLYNANGQLVIWGEIESVNTKLDLGWLPHGVYWLEIEGENRKIVKCKN